MFVRRDPVLLLLVPILAVMSACAAAPQPTTSPSPTGSAADAVVALSPVPLGLSVPAGLAGDATVGVLAGPYIDTLAPEAAAQVQFRSSSGEPSMVANLLWFGVDSYTALMATADAPKGIELGFQGDHVLFVQPALDMPFDPASQDAVAYGALVERARDFRWYSMLDASLVLLRPCPVVDAMPVVKVNASMLAAITDYFDQQGLLPVRLLRPTAWVLDVFAQAVGTHECANPDGGLGGYSGAVPSGATEAVMAYTAHAPYEATGAAATFVTLARMPGLGWMVVSEGTGP